MKLANNFLSATGMAASSEAIAMGVKAGLDPSLMCDVINAGSGMNTSTTQKFPRSVLPGTFDYGFGMTTSVAPLMRSSTPRRSVPSAPSG